MADPIDTHGHTTDDAEALYPGISDKDAYSELTDEERAVADGQYLAQTKEEVEAQIGAQPEA